MSTTLALLLQLVSFTPFAYSQSDESCKYWQPRHPDDTAYMCGDLPDPWYGMWPYVRKSTGGAGLTGTSSVDQYGQNVSVSASSGCFNLDGLLSCSPQTKLEIYNTGSLKEIPSNGLPDNVQELIIKNTGLEKIHPDTFKKLKSLKKLSIIESKLKEMPDLSGCDALEELDLFDNELKMFRNNFTTLPTSLKKIILVKNNIDKVPDGYFSLPNLEYLAISENQMRYFPGKAFRDVKKLIYIGVDANHIKSLVSIDFANLIFNGSQLLHLNASNNEINYIEPKILKKLSHLKILELHNNSMTHIQIETFWKIPELLHLDLVMNKIQILTTRSVESCPKLVTLRIHSQHNGFKMTAAHFDSLKDLKQLKNLWLSDNALTNFPHGLLFEDGWDSLTELYVGDNSITSLSIYSVNDFAAADLGYHSVQEKIFKPFSKNPSLTKLEVQNNAIGKIDVSDLEYCGNLYWLVLTGNRLEDSNIHHLAFQNTSISSLWLDSQSGGIQYVPASVKSNQSLSKISNLYLSGNKLTFIERGSFSDLTTLRELYLQSNGIIAIADGSFPTQIRRIDLSSNDFSFKNEHQFKDLSSLQFLSLSSNKIQIIPSDAFHGLSSLTDLRLSNNKIGRLLKIHFQDLESLTYLYLGNNEIAFIEDGTLASIKRDHLIHTIDIRSNRLSKIPVSDFWNMQLYYLYLQDNRITKIPSKAFVNITNCLRMDLTNNKIERIESNGFENVICSTSSSSYYINIAGNGKNILQKVSSFAFNNVQTRKLDLSYSYFEEIPANAFIIKSISDTLSLANGKIKTINEGAFAIENNIDNLDLENNQIEVINKNIFAANSQVKTLNLGNNKLRALHDDALIGLAITGSIKLQSNKLTVFPSRAIRSFTNLKTLTLSDNEILSIPEGSLKVFTNLQTLNLDNNKIDKLVYGIFRTNARLTTIYIRNNRITTIENGAFLFDTTPKIERIFLNGNDIDHVPTFGLLPDVREIYLAGVKTISRDVVASLPELKIFDVNSNKMQCDCHLFDALYDFMMTSPGVNDVRNAECTNPSDLSGYTVRKSDLESLPNISDDFVCTPTNLNATAPFDFTIKLKYKIPISVYPFVGQNITNNSSNTGSNVYFTAVCQTEGYPQFQGTSMNNDTVTINGVGTVLPGRDYTCYMFSTVETVNSTRNQTSANTYSVSVTTKEEKAKASSCSNGDPYDCVSVTGPHIPCKLGCDVNASNAMQADTCTADCCTTCYVSCLICNSSLVVKKIEFDVTYYDFGATDQDFDNVKYTENKFKDPRFVASPFGSWLAISAYPTGDSFSNWYRGTATNNKAITTKLVLLSDGSTDSQNQNKEIFRFWSDSFWPVNGKGFQSQGQRDCVTNALQNQGFTTSIRSVFTYKATEHLIFAGGEELWVFINGIMVLQILHNPSSNTIPCKFISLKDAADVGVLIPEGGYMDNGTCIITGALTGEQVSLNLKKNLRYGLDIFHAERFACKSEFLFFESGVEFVDLEEQQGDKPRIDYYVSVKENTPVTTILGEITIADAFYVGPFGVTVTSGNEEDRFDLQPNVTSTYNAVNNNVVPPSNEYTMQLMGETITLCSNSVTSVQPIPKSRSQPQAFPSFNSVSALLVLLHPLEYEATQSYLLRMVVTDVKTGLTGNITLQLSVEDINDHCPVLTTNQSSFYFKPAPVLQIIPLQNIMATDLDSGVNGKIIYKVSEVKETIPTIVSTKYVNNNSEIIWVNETTEYFISVQVFALDNGTPRRGDYVTFNVSYSATCHGFGAVTVDESNGGISFEAPGMAVSSYDSKECFGCKAGFYCPGNGQELRCGSDDATKYMYSFGTSSKCSTCPQGWLCSDGMIEKCPADTYATCNATYCPPQCDQCPPGTYCYEGKMYDCKPGSYSDGTGNCKLCNPGSYNNAFRQSSCSCCPAGYFSTYMKTSCEPCPRDEYSLGNCDGCKSCPSGSDCGCAVEPCAPGVVCRNIGLGGFKCESCLPGYKNSTGKDSCVDINECDETPCFQECVNQQPGYRCAGCPPGFLGTAPAGIGLDFARNNKQNCTDIDECQQENMCDVNSYCVNTQGSYYCGTCKAGYVGTGNGTCRLGDYCAIGLHNCHSNATCIPISAGKFKCKCKDGYAGDGTVCGPDDDYDGVSTEGVPCSAHSCKMDNCPNAPNSGQEDFDSDTLGDVCDTDDDNDNFPDISDTCQFLSDRNQSDTDSDGIGDVCDNCPSQANADQRDTDNDNIGDICDPDIDGDGVLNVIDNCDLVSNADQQDTDNDGVGDVCDTCPGISSTLADSNMNGYADECDPTNNDRDGDSVINTFDNCIDVPNADQSDVDNDGKGDACDDDSDGDGVVDDSDNCVFVVNPGQEHSQHGYDLSSNAIGDACLSDFDNDNINDELDSCPLVKSITTTSFQNHFLVDLSTQPSTQSSPKWRLQNKWRDVEQLVSTMRPSLLIGEQRYGEIDFSGTMFVNEDSEQGHYMGFVFGYQNNCQFYLVTWRHSNLNYLDTTYQAGIAGVQIKVINSTTGPGISYENALWHSEETSGQAKLLWIDPKLQPWQHKTPYIFRLQFKPSLGRIRLVIKKGQDVIADSNNIYDTSYTGGRVGLFTFGQGNVVWSNLNIQCGERVNHALQFDGSTVVKLPTLSDLKLTSSFTLSVWMKLQANHPSSKLPLICDTSGHICFYLQNSLVYGSINSMEVAGNTVISSDTWHYATLRYDAQAYELELFLNGTSEAKKTNVLPLTGSFSEVLYIGRDPSNYFRGTLDEITIWNVYISDEEILNYMTKTGLLWPKHQKIISAHYHMDEVGTPVSLDDDSGHDNNGQIANGKWVQSFLDKVRFQLAYPYNRRRRSTTDHEEL